MTEGDVTLFFGPLPFKREAGSEATMGQTMQYAKLGRTGLKVSRLGLGTMNFGPHASDKESFAIMDRALELGINFFDTANVYGQRKGCLLYTSPSPRDS